MLDSNDLLVAIKKAAIDAVNASKPTALVFGKVASTSPLKIDVEQKMTLTLAQLVLTRNVTDFKVSMTMTHITEGHTHTHMIRDTYTGGGSASSETHNHEYKGKKQFTIHNNLVIGEEVVLMQMQGGQKYLVLDRVVTV